MVRGTSLVGRSGDVSMRVLVFEDSYDIEKILIESGVDLSDWEL